MFVIMLSAVAATGLCGSLQLPENAVCEPVGRHVIVVDEAADVAPLREDLLYAAAIFEERFAHPAPPTVITTLPLDAAMMARFRQAGLKSQMPWNSPTRTVSSIRKSLLAQGLTQDRVESVMERMANGKPLTHELGHFWLEAVYWPSADDASSSGDTRPARYGSEGPDWLDELAAVANETQALTVNRREGFAALVAGGKLPDLDLWLSIEHPLYKGLSQDRPKTLPDSGTGVVTRTMSLEEVKKLEAASPMSAAAFYTMSRGVIDFIDERKGPRPYDAIARHIASGGDFDGWLKAHGAEYRLPDSQAAFKREFASWAQTRYGAVAKP